MGFRFRKSFKVMPGVRVNVGKKGISSVTVGKRGASISTGKQGTHANLGIKGTGLSYRTKLGGKQSTQADSGQPRRIGFFTMIILGTLVMIGLRIIYEMIKG